MYIYICPKNIAFRIINIPFILIVLRSFLAPQPLLKRGALLFSLSLLLVDFTSIVSSRVVILFSNYIIFLILYSLGVFIDAGGKNS
jgi:uncharacterized membrane protein